MTRITYHCPNCGDPDAEDATHCVTMDGTYYWDVRSQVWAPSDGPSGDDLYCSECGEIGGAYLHEVELPDPEPDSPLGLAMLWAEVIREERLAMIRAVEAGDVAQIDSLSNRIRGRADAMVSPGYARPGETATEAEYKLVLGHPGGGDNGPCMVQIIGVLTRTAPDPLHPTGQWSAAQTATLMYRRMGEVWMAYTAPEGDDSWDNLLRGWAAEYSFNEAASGPDPVPVSQRLLEALELAETRLDINNCQGEEDIFLAVIRAAIALAKGGAE